MSRSSAFHLNKDLPVIKPGWQGNQVVKDCFVNLSNRSKHGFGNILKWRFSPNPQRKEKKAEKWEPNIHFLYSLKKAPEDSAVWLGHNSFFLQVAGKRLMLDPVFGNIPFVKRRSKLPANPDIFTDIDYILISHDHFDHMDKRSIALLFKNNPKVKVFCGLNTKSLLQKWFPGIEVIEAGWYQQLTDGELKLTFLPAQHWGKRSVSDGGKRLWGAFMIQSNTISIYYSGDTGYSQHFSEIKELFGSPDIAMLGIGAYKPRWFMQPNHISPLEALSAAKKMGAGITIPMHYGTFDLSDEPLSDPPTVFAKEADKQNIRITIPCLGELIPLKRNIRQRNKSLEAAYALH